MYAKRVRLTNSTGLHIRPATRLMETASRFQSDIQVFGNAHVADAKSAISLMMLEASPGTEVLIQACGEDEVHAVEALIELVQRQFDERIET